MGKKSRKKRERRNDPFAAYMKIAGGRAKSARKDFDEDFKQRYAELQAFFKGFHPEDVAVALNVSDLWLPNISSQAKHHFAFGTLLATQDDQFDRNTRIETYEQFRDFIEKVHALLPNFPSLEDYIPEADWGEVKVRSRDSYLRIFYGSNVERIPDFIEAYRLLHQTQPDALNDMDLAIRLQDGVISAVSRDVVGVTADISPGHIEIPSEQFWTQCRRALSAEDVWPEIRPELVLAPGHVLSWNDWSSFGDAVMEGISLPGLVVQIDGKYIPLSMRNATNVVIDLWAQEKTDTPDPSPGRLCQAMANFLTARIDHRSIVKGPLFLETRDRRLNNRFVALIQASKKFHLVLSLPIEEITGLEELVGEVQGLLNSGEEWALIRPQTGHMFQIRKQDGSLPQGADMNLLVVFSRVATSSLSIPIPDTGARLMSLPDFVTVFDALDDTDELDRFWTYVDGLEPLTRGFMGGPADLFASFRDSHAQLIDGALTPTLIAMDPHWGSSWRYNELTKFWSAAPPKFPDDKLSWRVEEKTDGLYKLTAKSIPQLSWCTVIKDCAVHFVFDLQAQDLKAENGRLLELLIHCAADSLSQRRDILSEVGIFDVPRITVLCLADPSALVTLAAEDIERAAQGALASGWRTDGAPTNESLRAVVDINLARLQSGMNSVTDSRFETHCAIALVEGLCNLMGQTFQPWVRTALASTDNRRPRFNLKLLRRAVDVPDFTRAVVPEPEQYKIARRDLAIILKGQGVEPGKYELAEAKDIINRARDELRVKVHTRIATMDRTSLLRFSIEQHDALTAAYQRENYRLKHSLSHEVSFDRQDALSEAHERFTREARNYRYLLECALTAASGEMPALGNEVILVVAAIDWLFVLYGASDVLHNGIDAGGIVLDSQYVPRVFYSPNRQEQEQQFLREVAASKLGLNLVEDDEVNSAQNKGLELSRLNQAFEQDLQFTYSHLLQCLFSLAAWVSIGGATDLQLSYDATRDEMAQRLCESIDSLQEAEAHSILRFLTLQPGQVRRLLGRTVDESDVPVWEHIKRGSRYTIRPLIEIAENRLAWGAAAADRAAHIWSGSISDGYLPAGFQWPNVKQVVGSLKKEIEDGLEVRAFDEPPRVPWRLFGLSQAATVVA